MATAQNTVEQELVCPALPSLEVVMDQQRAEQRRLDEEGRQERLTREQSDKLIEVFHGVRNCNLDCVPPQGDFYEVFAVRIVALAQTLVAIGEFDRLVTRVGDIAASTWQLDCQARVFVVHLLNMAKIGEQAEIASRIKDATTFPFANRVFEWLRRNLEQTFFSGSPPSTHGIAFDDGVVIAKPLEAEVTQDLRRLPPPLNLHDIDFRPILDATNTVLVTARRFHAWNHDGSIGRTGGELLLKLSSDLDALRTRLREAGMHDLSRPRLGDRTWQTPVKALQDICFDDGQGEDTVGLDHPAFVRRIEVAAEMVKDLLTMKSTSIAPPPEPEKPADIAPEAVEVALHAQDQFTFTESVECWERRPPLNELAHVVLRGRGERPVVLGKEKNQLTRPQYDVVASLLEAGPEGLTKDKLAEKSKHDDARRILKRLAIKDEDWAAVIQFPKTTGRGYRIQ